MVEVFSFSGVADEALILLQHGLSSDSLRRSKFLSAPAAAWQA